MANKRRRKKSAKKAAQKRLSVRQVQLRQDIAIANKRLKRFEAAGINSPAAERLRTALNLQSGESIKIGKNATLNTENLISRAVKAFLAAATSTVKGYKQVEAKRLQKAAEYVKDLGVEATPENIKRVMTGMRTFGHYQEQYSIGSGEVAKWVAVIAEQGGDAVTLERALKIAYDSAENADNIDVQDISDEQPKL